MAGNLPGAPPLRAAAALGVTYRTMTDGDLPFVAALYASTRAQEVASTGWPPEMQAAFLQQQHLAQHSHYQRHYADAAWLIIQHQGADVGRLYLDPQPHDLGVIDISLIPAVRGQGIGGAVLRDVLAMAADSDRVVGIHVEKTNPARRLYERLGFEMAEDKGIYDYLVARPTG